MDPISLTTERLKLCAFTADDVEDVYAACQDPGIQRWIPAIPIPYERSDAADFVGLTVPTGWRDDTAYSFCVRLRDGGSLVGSAGLHHPREGGWEVGFWTAPEHRGRGYATEITLALARWAFTELGSVRLEWRAQVGNAASLAVARKAGFTVEGVNRAAIRDRGTVRDGWVASLLPSDLGLASALPYLSAPASAPGVRGAV
ncbi:GNAT family N-acetyltransferase [Streptomyces sp. NPDC127084]|uniref:GNAT family N-acetyltransferase n=1 Tax=Streptomyces sp. NPDC127084 TaxID=3347133 RepID=UPI003663087A